MSGDTGSQAAQVVVRSRADLERIRNTDIGPSPWIAITQDMIDSFAAVTLDRQWIHTEPARAAGTDRGSTVAHGYLILSLGPALMRQILNLDGVSEGLNYGVNRVRFPSVTPVDSEVRLRLAVRELEDRSSGLLARFDYTFERRGSDRPVCVAQQLSLFRFVGDRTREQDGQSAT